MLYVDEYVNNATNAETASDSHDIYIGAEFNFLGSFGNPIRSIVRKRIIKNDGETISVVNHKPLLYTRKYELQYLDGFMEEITANQISENVLSQVES